MKLLILLFLFSLSCSDSKKQSNIKSENNSPKNELVSEITNNNNNSIKNNSNQIKTENLQFTFEIIEEIPHDTDAYTQGLIFKNNYLYESTGQYGKSSLRKVNPKTGIIEKKISIGFIYFAEGIEVLNENIYLLTWKNNICKVYDINTFEEVDEKRYAGEGWGLCLANNKFYMSNGSNIIQILDSDSFLPIDQFPLNDLDGFALYDINELEFAKGYIFANLWMKDKIAVIDINSRSLVKIIDFSELRNKLGNKRNAEVMNGIAYDKKEDVFYITGKYWDKVFIVKIK